jgi:hypothetical protein
VVSGVAAGLGAAATAATLLTPVDGGSQVWIDEPTANSILAPGTVTVTAHATDPGRLDGLELRVDGKSVDQDRSLDRSDLLVFAVFTWKATAGAHELVVTQLGGARTISDSRLVTVGGPAPSPSPTPSKSPKASPTPSSSPTPSATPVPTPEHSTRPPPEPAPVIDSTTFVGTPTVYAFTSCPYTVQVQARIRGATSARAVISGVGSVPMSGSSSTWTATISSGFPSGQDGGHTVSVTASGPGGSATQAVGTLTIKPACPKD